MSDAQLDRGFEIDALGVIGIVEVVEAPGDDAFEGLDVTSPSEITDGSFQSLGQSSAVHVYDVGCGTGAGTSITMPVNAFGWHCRLGYFRADGGRIGLSVIVDFMRSYYPPSVVRARFNGRLPSGTRDLRAFWWYGEGDERGPVYWR